MKEEKTITGIDGRYEKIKKLASSTMQEMTKLGFDNGQYKLFLIQLENEYHNAKINYQI